MRHRLLLASIVAAAALAAPAFAADPPVARHPPAAGTTAAAAPAHARAAATASMSTPPSVPQAAAAAVEDDPDRDVNIAQPDFALAALPTTLRLPRFATSFRMTHRFNEPIDDAGPGGLFGMDSGALVGVEFRVGLARGWQAVFYRTSDRTIQLSTQYDVRQQRGGMPIGIAAIASVEGTNNFQDRYSPAVGAVLSRELGTRGALYVEPVWVNNVSLQHAAAGGDDSTVLLGVGGRLRVLATTYVVAEVIPRMGGNAPGTTQAAFGIERRAGGHLFQLTFANGLGTTWAQIARGGPPGNNWYLGFNLSRKFY